MYSASSLVPFGLSAAPNKLLPPVQACSKRPLGGVASLRAPSGMPPATSALECVAGHRRGILINPYGAEAMFSANSFDRRRARCDFYAAAAAAECGANKLMPPLPGRAGAGVFYLASLAYRTLPSILCVRYGSGWNKLSACRGGHCIFVPTKPPISHLDRVGQRRRRRLYLHLPAALHISFCIA